MSHAVSNETAKADVNQLDGNRPLPWDREVLGRMAREAWVRWAQTQPSPKDSWLIPYDSLNEAEKEAHRQVGEHLARWTLVGDAARAALATPVQSSMELPRMDRDLPDGAVNIANGPRGSGIKNGETIFWYGSEDEHEREMIKACQARCKQDDEDGCPRPDHFCTECEMDAAFALRTTHPKIIAAIKSGDL